MKVQRVGKVSLGAVGETKANIKERRDIMKRDVLTQSQTTCAWHRQQPRFLLTPPQAAWVWASDDRLAARSDADEDLKQIQ
eukprot:8785267-Pyramimonas_sp.AAC.1